MNVKRPTRPGGLRTGWRNSRAWLTAWFGVASGRSMSGGLAVGVLAVVSIAIGLAAIEGFATRALAAGDTPVSTSSSEGRAHQVTSSDSRLLELDPTLRLAVVTAIETARAESLPSEAILLRALEGTTKGAPLDRILKAVSTLLDRLRTSRRLLGPTRAPEELIAAAGCLAAGIDTTTVRKLGDRQRQEPLVVPMIVLTDLVGRGTPIESAALVTFDMLAAGMADRQFLDLRTAVQQDLQNGVRPAEALLARYRALPRGAGATSPAGLRSADPRARTPGETNPIPPSKRTGH